MNGNEYAEMLARRRAAARSLEDIVVLGFLALDDAARERVAARFDDHFANLGSRHADRWSLVKREVAP